MGLEEEVRGGGRSRDKEVIEREGEEKEREGEGEEKEGRKRGKD